MQIIAHLPMNGCFWISGFAVIILKYLLHGQLFLNNCWNNPEIPGVYTTHYSVRVVFGPSRVRVGQQIPSSSRVLAGPREDIDRKIILGAVYDRVTRNDLTNKPFLPSPLPCFLMSTIAMGSAWYCRRTWSLGWWQRLETLIMTRKRMIKSLRTRSKGKNGIFVGIFPTLGTVMVMVMQMKTLWWQCWRRRWYEWYVHPPMANMMSVSAGTAPSTPVPRVAAESFHNLNYHPCLHYPCPHCHKNYALLYQVSGRQRAHP